VDPCHTVSGFRGDGKIPSGLKEIDAAAFRGKIDRKEIA
jgi:hypothetical protein